MGEPMERRKGMGKVKKEVSSIDIIVDALLECNRATPQVSAVVRARVLARAQGALAHAAPVPDASTRRRLTS